MGVLAGDQVPVGQRGRDESAVVLVFARAEHQSFAHAFFRDGEQQLVVQFGLACAQDDER